MANKIEIFYKNNQLPNSQQSITYDPNGNIKELYYNNNQIAFTRNYKVSNITSAFINSNINLSLHNPDKNVASLYIQAASESDVLENFEYVYKGNRALESINSEINPTCHFFKYHNLFEDLPTNALYLSCFNYHSYNIEYKYYKTK